MQGRRGDLIYIALDRCYRRGALIYIVMLGRRGDLIYIALDSDAG